MSTVHCITLISIASILAARTVFCGIALEPFTYSQDFETRELSAWASYPIWQDAAYDEKMRVNTIVPGDPNISLEQMVIPYSHVDAYAGAQKKLDMYFVPGSTISLRFYLKTQLAAEFFKVRLAAGHDGTVDYTVSGPSTNRWVPLMVTYEDFIRENPRLAGKNVRVNALAVLAKFPYADPALNIYLGLDDVVFNGARATHFQFIEPQMYTLSERKPYIPRTHYKKNDTFILSGRWPLDTDRVTLTVVPFTDRSRTIAEPGMKKSGDTWKTQFRLSLPEGLYLGTLTAFRGKEKLSDTEFTIYIAPQGIGGKHPRLWFDAVKERQVKERLGSERFKTVKDDLLSSAKKTRDIYKVTDAFFDIDQFPEEDWIPTLDGWFDRINAWRDGIYYNALAGCLLGDEEAAVYAKGLMLEISKFPYWLHPWMHKRGRHIYYPLGELGMDIAIGFDLLYDRFTPAERTVIRTALMNNIIIGAHKGYVEDDLVTCNSSNWVAHITGGSLMSQAVMYGDDHEYGDMEPYFTGAILKDYDLIQTVIDRDGAYGEGYGYYDFSMLSWSKSLPAVENVFKIDLSGKLNGSYRDLAWSGDIKSKKYLYFGDSSGSLGPLTNWAWLLDKNRDPLLGWLYNHLKAGETFMDVLYETSDVPKHEPFGENPVRFFRDVGTTVFKSGWNSDDFIFIMRSGPFINHQHLDQGTFWLSDRGRTFIEERHGSTYYLDNLYQPYYIQPFAHSTILIDNNYQSQRTGDPLVFAEGFEDYAYLEHCLDGGLAAFSSGNIGRLYWGKVADMSRNVLYIKPRTVLMVDVVVPGDRDVEAKLLYQTHLLEDIVPGGALSTITKDGLTLNIAHIAPDIRDVKAEIMPHFYYTLLNEKKLMPEGCLSVSSRTEGGKPLVMANILTTEPVASSATVKGDGFIRGTAAGTPFTFSTKPGMMYDTGEFSTDALAVAWDGGRFFAARCTKFTAPGVCSVSTAMPITFEISKNTLHYVHNDEDVAVVTDGMGKQRTFTLPEGEGTITF